MCLLLRLRPPQVAGAATGSSPVQATLRQHLEELALVADGWYRRVTLAWPYAGGHVEIVGEAGALLGGCGAAVRGCCPVGEPGAGRPQRWLAPLWRGLLLGCSLPHTGLLTNAPPCPCLQWAAGTSGRRWCLT